MQNVHSNYLFIFKNSVLGASSIANKLFTLKISWIPNHVIYLLTIIVCLWNYWSLLLKFEKKDQDDHNPIHLDNVHYYDPPPHYTFVSLTSSALITTNPMIGPLQKYTTEPLLRISNCILYLFVCSANDEKWLCVFCIFVFFSVEEKYSKKGTSTYSSEVVNISTAEPCTILYLKLKVTFVTHSWLLSKIVMAA